MKKTEGKITIISNEYLNHISGGENSTHDLKITPNITGSENVAIGNISVTYPITDNIGVNASTTFATDYNMVVYPENTFKIYINYPL